MKLGYILLVHEPFEKLRPLLDTLTKYNDVIALHYDNSIPHKQDIELIKQHYPSVLCAERVQVEWGEASIVQATLNAMQVIIDSEHELDYITLLSGSCFPVKSRDDLIQHLSNNLNSEFIECHDIKQSQWVKQGLEAGRWEFFHFFNWRKSPRLFSLSEKIQRKLRIKRTFPFGKKMYMGSQWWTLSYSMVEKILSVTYKENLMPFVEKTSIPDEYYFQTLTANLIDDKNKIVSPLMHYRFNDVGIPKVFSKSDLNELSNTKCFFARKMNHSDNELKSILQSVYSGSSELVKEEKEEKEKLNQNFSWYREYGFRNWLHDYPLPIVIIIEKSELNTINLEPFCSKLSVFGHLFDSKKIDFHLENDLPLYKERDVVLRDFDRQEFMTHICLASPTGFIFKTKNRMLEHIPHTLIHSRNALFIDLYDDIETLNELRVSEKLENYLRTFSCKYHRAKAEDNEEISKLIECHINDNLYLNTLNNLSYKAKL